MFSLWAIQKNVRSSHCSLGLRKMNAYKEVKGQKHLVMQVNMPEGTDASKNGMSSFIVELFLTFKEGEAQSCCTRNTVIFYIASHTDD